MKRFSAVCLSAFALLFLCSCSIISTEPYKKVYYFDVGTPSATVSIAKKMNSINVQGNAPYYEKMVFRDSANSIQIDEFNRWSAMPAILIQRYISEACLNEVDSSGQSQSSDYSLKIDIFQFEMNLTDKTAVCNLAFTVEDNSNSRSIWHKVYSQKVPVKDLSAAAFAAAMKENLDKVAAAFAEDMKKLK